MTRHQEVQAKLRDTLRECLKDTCEQGELPTLDAIHKIKIPYLDAFLEEMTRLSHTSMSNGRITTQDVEVLGHHIPKGVEVWLMVNRHSFSISNNTHTNTYPQNTGPSQTAPPFDIPNSRRRSGNKSEARNSAWTGAWEPHSLSEFMPERWLRKSEDGTSEFDPQAGPNHSFGVGPRGCFGEWYFHAVNSVNIIAVTDILQRPKTRHAYYEDFFCTCALGIRAATAACQAGLFCFDRLAHTSAADQPRSSTITFTRPTMRLSRIENKARSS